MKCLKKVISLLLCILLLCAMMPLTTLSAGAAQTGTTGECTWEIDGTVLTISGNGSMGDYDYHNNPAPWKYRNLTQVVFESGITNIAEDAFFSMSSLESVTIPDTVTMIGDSAFMYCGLTSVDLPDSVTRIGNNAFYGCASLVSITIPDSVISIGQEALHNTQWFSNQSGDIIYAGKVAYSSSSFLRNAVIKDDTLGIADKAFFNISSLRSVSVPDSVIYIGESSFAYTKSLTEFSIGKSVASIGNYAFYNCTGLETVTIPRSVTSIGKSAFSSCGKLADVYYGGALTGWNNISIGTGNDPLQNAALHYATPDASGTCGENLSWELWDDELIISGTGAMNHYDLYNNVRPPWWSLKDQIRTVRIGATVTTIGNSAFYQIPVESLIIEDNINGVTGSDLSIGEYAFSSTKLKSIDFGKIDGGRNILLNERCFSYCEELTSLTLPRNISFSTTYYNDAFTHCDSLESAAIYCPVIGGYAFEFCESLSSVTLDGVTEIKRYAFRANAMEEITIPASVTTIDDYAFLNRNDNNCYLSLIKAPNCSAGHAYAVKNKVNFQAIDTSAHTYQVDKWNWSDDHTAATLTFNCTRYHDDTQTLDAEVTVETEEASCTQDGCAKYTATITFEGETYSDEYTETLPALGHDYVESLTGDGKHLFTCSRCGDSYIVEPTYLGDTDGDGEITMMDVTFIQRVLANLDLPGNVTFNEAAADVDGDGEVTTSDVTWIQRMLAHMDTPYAIGGEMNG